MINRDFLNILNEISRKEVSFHKAEEENEHLFGHVIGYLLYLRYKEIISFKSIKDKEDISSALSQSKHRNAAEILELWKELEDNYPYLEELSALLTRYDFSRYQNAEQEVELARWCNENYLLPGIHYVHRPTLNRLMCLGTVFGSQKQLGIRTDVEKLLVISDTEDIIRFILDKSSPDMCITFSIKSDKHFGAYGIRINALILDCHSNIRLSSGNLESYDGVILDNDLRKEKNSWETYLDLVNQDGFLLALNQEISGTCKAFYSNEIPLMFETTEGISLLCKKVGNSSDIVRYGFYDIEGEFDFYEKDSLIRKFTECIKNDISAKDYQILTKTDFIVSKDIHFHKVKRSADQVDFVWKRKDEIITIDTDMEWLYDSEISDDKIIYNKYFSDNPFVIKAKQDFRHDMSIYTPGKEQHILEGIKIERSNGLFGDMSSWATNDSMYDMMKGCYGFNGICEDYKGFDKSLCCRVLTHPAILYYWKNVLKVDASPERPVVIRKYNFYFDHLCMKIDGGSCMESIKINPEYDENFIIYQLLKEEDPNNNYILCAPTKEEQHTYYINKRLDYLSEYKPIVDEMEDEVQRSVSESPAHITGVGFTNFRRFADLPSLPLAGVNIIVGGNNSGKSTFVKGLLLMFDNIKNMTIRNIDDELASTRFQFDANNFHDVHIGTFDRAYSNNAKEESTGKAISFSMSFSHFELKITVSPQSNEDSTSVPVTAVSVFDHKRNAEFIFDLKNSMTSARFSIGSELVDYNDRSVFRHTKPGEHKIVSLLRSIVSIKGNPVSRIIDEEQSKKIQSKAGFILEIADELEQIINNTSLEYIYAHGVNQKVLFNYNDKNDYMAQTLHDLMTEKISKVEREFVCKWLNEFDLGTDFDVHSIGGEAYIIQIKDRSGKMVYLADMGMGANQLVILILRLAILIHRHRMGGNKVYRPTVVIEEPEQNMHPGYQSKLATLFHDIHEAYGFNFIIETHSEYLVRRSQVIVAHKKYQDDELKANNPFMVYYFPTEGLPYEMNYRKDGNFSNEFGKGFYDEANNLLFEII